MDEPWTNLDSQDSSWPGLGGSHHLPPYSILYASPQSPHPNGILSRDSSGLPNGNPEIPKVGTFATLGPITLCADLRLR